MLLPTPELPLTHALARGTQVLGRQQLQHEMKQSIVPLGTSLWNLVYSRVVNAPPGLTTNAGCRRCLTSYVAAVAPLALAVFTSIILPLLPLTCLVSLLTVPGRLLSGPHGDPIINGPPACLTPNFTFILSLRVTALPVH